jgi:hypothetical protein
MLTEENLKYALGQWEMADWVADTMGTTLSEVPLAELHAEISNKHRLLCERDIYDVLCAMVHQYTFLDPQMNAMLKDFVVAYEVYLILEKYTRGQLKALVYKNHGIPPRKRKNGKLYWALAFLETRRYGFNTFGLRSSLNDDTLYAIHKFL